MSSRILRRTTLPRAAAVLAAALLAACGGGGGGDDGPPGTIDLSVANRDSVAHAVAAASLGLGGADLVVSGSATLAVQRQLAQSVASARARALAVTAPIDEPCTLAGLTRISVDDRDNNGLPSAGDVMTVQFVQCRDSADETIDGTVVLTFSQVGDNGFSGRLTQSALSLLRQDGVQQHRITTDGAFQLTVSAPSDTQASLRLVADGPVVSVLSTPVFSDTVTLHDGYLKEAAFDDLAAPPPGGGTTPGRSSLSTSGRLTSQAAAGEVTVRTVGAIVQYADDAFPRAGALDIAGRNGALRITAQSTEQVQLDVDTNADGTYESSTLQRWDWLI